MSKAASRFEEREGLVAGSVIVLGLCLGVALIHLLAISALQSIFPPAVYLYVRAAGMLPRHSLPA